MKTAQKESSPMRSQVLYNLGLCLWQLSFDEGGMKQLLEAPVVEPLVALLKEGVTASIPCRQHCQLYNSRPAVSCLDTK